MKLPIFIATILLLNTANTTPTNHHTNKNEFQDNQVPQITPEFFEKHHSDFTKWVLKKKNQLSVRHKWWVPEVTIDAGAIAKGYTKPHSRECMRISYHFFDQPDSYIKSVLSTINLTTVAKILVEYKNNPDHPNVNVLSFICHKEHIESISLPAGISKDQLTENPAQYNELIKKGKVDVQACHQNIAIGLFAQYCDAKKLL